MLMTRFPCLVALAPFSLLIFANPSMATAPGEGADSLPLPNEVMAVELFRLPEPCSGIFASYPDGKFRGIVTSGSGLYRFKANGEHELLRRMEQPTALIQHPTGRLLVADAAKPGVYIVSRTPTTDRLQGKSITRETEDRPLHEPMWLLQELRHVALNSGLETTVTLGHLYLSDRGSGNADKPSGLIFHMARDRDSPTGYATRVAAGGLASPHGMALSKDRSVLYVAEGDTNQILAFPVAGSGELGEAKILAELPKRDAANRLVACRPAGLCLDDAGNIYVAHGGMGVIQVLDATGELLRTYDAGMPWPTGIAFGTRGDGRPGHLYIAGRTGNNTTSEGIVVRLELDVKGLRMLPDTF
jgi:gluconolactonase